MAALVEPNRGLIELYFSADVMNTAIGRLEAEGGTSVRTDAGAWTAENALAAIGEALSFPDYFGGNLDAMADCMFDVVAEDPTFPAGTTPKILAIYQFDSFQKQAPALARQILDVLYDAAIMGLKLGRPFLVMLQSDDGDLTIPPVRAQPITWNQAEFQRTKRTRR